MTSLKVPIEGLGAEAGGFVFGTSNDATLGTWIYEKFNAPLATDPQAQQIKTCTAILRDRGQVISPVCQQLQREGKLTRDFIPRDFIQGYGVD